jgi:hypothetical protein
MPLTTEPAELQGLQHRLGYDFRSGKHPKAQRSAPGENSALTAFTSTTVRTGDSQTRTASKFASVSIDEDKSWPTAP